MNKGRFAQFFSGYYVGNDSWDYVDFDMVEARARQNTSTRWIVLSYDVERRLFYAVINRSSAEDGDFDHKVELPRRAVDALRDILKPEDLARCLRKTLALTHKP